VDFGTFLVACQMEKTEGEKGASTTLRRRVAEFIWYLLISPVLFFLFLYALPFLCVVFAFMVVTGAYSGVVFHYRVRQSRRYLRWREARERFREQGGTLIVELNTIG
jgi:Flp pilus assembly protein TadB